jgi:hypothetical protein
LINNFKKNMSWFSKLFGGKKEEVKSSSAEVLADKPEAAISAPAAEEMPAVEPEIKEEVAGEETADEAGSEEMK